MQAVTREYSLVQIVVVKNAILAARPDRSCYSADLFISYPHTFGVQVQMLKKKKLKETGAQPTSLYRPVRAMDGISPHDGSLTLRQLLHLMAEWSSFEDLAAFANVWLGACLSPLEFSSLRYTTEGFARALSAALCPAPAHSILVRALVHRFAHWPARALNDNPALCRSLRWWKRACGGVLSPDESLIEGALLWWDVEVEF